VSLKTIFLSIHEYSLGKDCKIYLGQLGDLSMNLPKDIQKKNFHDAMKKMTTTPGWDILEENTLLALKSGAHIPLVNTV